MAAVLLGTVALVVGVWACGRWRQGGLSLEVLGSAFRALRWPWLLAASVLALSTYWIRALRWRAIMAPVKEGASLGNLLVATVVGFTGVLVVGRAGEIVRPYMVARKEGLPLASQLGVWTVERAYDLLASLVLLGWAVASLGSGLNAGLRVLAWSGVVLALACLGSLALVVSGGEWVERQLMIGTGGIGGGVGAKVREMLTAFLGGTATLRSGRAQLKVCLYTAAEWIAVIAACWALFRASPWTTGIGLAQSAAFVGWVTVGSIVQLPGIGGGVQAVSTVVLSGAYGLPVEAAVAVSIALWVVTFVAVAPLGLVLGLREGVNWVTIASAPEGWRA
ncbi:MAG: lysylphosphatidylglycerol synthase transmembrane domain-containing protein [Bryobacteraceae bacterium]